MFKLKDIMARSGATLDTQYNSLQLSKGYQVSVCDLEIIPSYALRKAHLVKLLKNLKANQCLGVWIDQGKAYIDISTTFSNKRQALAYGKQHNQISVWDWKHSTAIACA